MAVQNETWTTIESDPGVFTELIQNMGVQGVQMEELYSLDRHTLLTLRPVYGLIFLFKWKQEKDLRPPESNYHGKVFFANQVINNACATQAILSVLLNCKHLELGQQLTDFKSFTADFPPDLKGLAISNSDSIRQAHNSFSPPQPIVPDEAKSSDKDDEAYHFISYVPVDGALYELDGLKAGPIKIADCTEDDWLDKAVPAITERTERYAKTEIRFNLMAVIKNRKDTYNQELQSLLETQDKIQLRISDDAGVSGDDNMNVDDLPTSQDALQDKLHQVQQQVSRVQQQLQQETEKQQDWHNENLRRKHNYIPFLFNFLKVLANKKQLDPLIHAAR
ncbi:hypothetical protein ABBQ32_010109 [Trebouxia sp. C0010 RCD-2024]